ncbi:membrane protein [Pseudovibrio japonicus]|uniref:Membrane protein n=1 Tax=Pseudovibrio japonicus TaxID=366534 RepID=A0ABQ3EPT5_9HYPH|nr:four-carbon acid sugar kinase family protein [Pseudovibrio japonicus]GHB50600.1 membrane protein [Pseudovibrio japonicus]
MNSNHNTLPLLGIIADDLTSATDFSAPFVRKGLSAEVCGAAHIRWEKVTSEIISVDCDSRAMTAKEAAKASSLATRGLANVPFLCKTIDSTLRGHIRDELLACYNASGRSRLVIAPAFPEAGRTTVGGVQYVNGTPVSQSVYAKDPSHPAWTSRVADLVCEDIRNAVILDAQNQTELNSQVASIDRPEDVLWVGSPGLAIALAETKSQFSFSPPEQPSAEHTLVVIGSANPISHEQAAQLNGLRFATCVTAPVERANDPKTILSDLADEAVEVMQKQEITALIATGGETMKVLLDRLHVHRFSLLGEFETGFPIGRATFPNGRNLIVGMKAGGFGSENSLYDAVHALKKNSKVQGERNT